MDPSELNNAQILQILECIFINFFLFYKNGKVNKYKLFRTNKRTKSKVVSLFLSALEEDDVSTVEKYSIWMEIIRPFMKKRVRKFDQVYLDALGFSTNLCEQEYPFHCDISAIGVEDDVEISNEDAVENTINHDIEYDVFGLRYSEQKFQCDISTIENESDEVSSVSMFDILSEVSGDNQQANWDILNNVFCKFFQENGKISSKKLSNTNKREKLRIITSYFKALKIINRTEKEKLAEWDYLTAPFNPDYKKFEVQFFGEQFAKVVTVIIKKSFEDNYYSDCSKKPKRTC